MTPAKLAAHRWLTTTALAVCLGVVGWLARRSQLDFPLVQDPVPARALVGIGVAVVAQLPLHSSFPQLEASLSREPRIRVLRVTGVLALVGVSTAPTWAATADDPRWSANLVLAGLLSAIAITSVVLLGDLAWTVPLAVGVLAVVLDTDPQYPVSEALSVVPPGVAVVALGAAALLYVRHGPRH